MSVGIHGAARFAGLATPAPLTLLQPLITHRVLDPVDVHVASMLAARFGEPDPEVVLAAALAVRAPRYGHVCVDLRAVRAHALLPEARRDDDADRDALAAELALPPDREAWLTRVAASPLVRPPGPGSTPLVLQDGRLYTDRYFAYEDRLHEGLRARFADAREVLHPALLRRGLDALFESVPAGEVDRQRLAAAAALLRGATVISGGPGTGKTYTVRNLLTLLYAQWAASPDRGPRPRIALAAPTGKAAARVVDAIRDGLDGHLEKAEKALPPGASVDDLRAFLEQTTPFTLHRLLGWRPDDPTRFRHHRDRPLPLDIVIVDEASMVDLALMAKLVDAVPTGARLVLLGDRHQLASVEAGSVLGDVCGDGDGALRLSKPAADVLERVAGLVVTPTEAEPGPWDAVVFLTKSRRFDAASGIGDFAVASVGGDVDGAVAALAPWGPGEPGSLVVRGGKVVGRDLGRLAHDPGGLPKEARDAIVEGYRPCLERLRAGPRLVDGVREPLQAVHADALRLLDGFRVLCAHRRGRFGVEGLGAAAQALLTEAKLIRPSGAWWVGRPVLVTANDYSVRRFNGDVGLVVRDEHGDPVVAFPGDGGGVSYLTPVRLPAHETVFAMTVHKSQGSEFTDVLVVLPDAPSPILTRELVYTGVTRAKKRVTVLSDEAVLRAALQRRVQRASGLAEVLWRA